MKIQKSRFFQIVTAFCFCLALGVLTVPAFASTSSKTFSYVKEGLCPNCGAPAIFTGSTVKCRQYSVDCSANCGVIGPNSYASHRWVESNRVEPTCTSIGSVFYTCRDCDLVTYTEELPVLGNGEHTWIEISRIPATCTASGLVTTTCSTCGEIETEEFPALDHDWQETGSTSPTCTDTGSIRRTCTRCSLTASEVVPALGLAHDWQETSRTEATETAAGSIGYTCSTCSAVRSERIPPTGLDLSMSGLLEKMTAVLVASLGWVSVVADVIARNPILLLVVVIGFIGTGVVLFRRMLRL